MARLPATRSGKISFYESHVPTWEERAAEIGVSSSMIANLAALTQAARDAFLRAQEARNAAEAATQAYHTAVATMNRAGVNVLTTIRVYASTTNNTGVLNIAKVDPRADNGPLPAPGTPIMPSTSLSQTGAVTLSWKCKNPRGSEGTVYEICRRVDGERAFTRVGTSGTRKYTDDAIPRGASTIVYQVTAIRSTRRGNPALFNVRFGMDGETMKIAA